MFEVFIYTIAVLQIRTLRFKLCMQNPGEFANSLFTIDWFAYFSLNYTFDGLGISTIAFTVP